MSEHDDFRDQEYHEWGMCSWDICLSGPLTAEFFDWSPDPCAAHPVGLEIACAPRTEDSTDGYFPAKWNVSCLISFANHSPIDAMLSIILRGAIASILRMTLYFAHYRTAMHDPTCKLHLRICIRTGKLTSPSTRLSIKLGALAAIEGGVILIAACLMSIWPLFTRLMPRGVQASLSRHSPRHSPRDYHEYWYLREFRDDKTREEIARWREVQDAEDNCGNSPPSPCSLADLEDQRLSILVDERVSVLFKSGVQFSLKLKVYRVGK